MRRYLMLDVFDYSGNLIVNLYDSTKEMSGEAVNIHKIEERNGWKELSFTLPSKCTGEDGEEDNYRLQYLVADYKIRFIEEKERYVYNEQTKEKERKRVKEKDWFLISEPKITHNAYSKTVDVVASHIAELLKTKRMSLEFSDDEGNNVGTAEELVATVLDTTDWNVGECYQFLETYGGESETKYRSLVAGSKTGAFRLIEMICELFDAKPVYYGDEHYDSNGILRPAQTVDIIPMNPFSKDKFTGSIPTDVLEGNNKVFELHYDKNLKNVSRTLNTSNIVTKLYAYGSYGDKNGLCSIQTCKHKEYTFETFNVIPEGKEICFEDEAYAKFYFTVDVELPVGTKFIYSKLDFASRSYIYSNETRTDSDGNEIVGHAYRVYKEPKTEGLEKISDYATLTENEEKDNLFPYLFNFSYYDEIGLLTDDKLQEVAKFQMSMPELYDTSVTAATNFYNQLSTISKIGNANNGFLRFAATGYTVNKDTRETTITIDLTQGDSTIYDNVEYRDGILYRSDYLANHKNKFIWHVASELKSNGDPVSGNPSYVLVAHATNPITWEKAYVKEIWAQDKNGNPYRVNKSDGNPGDFDYMLNQEYIRPCKLVLWPPMSVDSRERYLPAYTNTDQFFLFCTYSQSGQICALELQEEAIVNSDIKTSLGAEFETHPVYFMDVRTETIHDIPTSVVALDNQYGWCYGYYLLEARQGDMYFCGKLDKEWHPVTIGITKPAGANHGDYFFDSVYRVIWCYLNGKWVEYESSDEKRIAQNFSKVQYFCNKRDELHRGLWDYYYHTVDGTEIKDKQGEALPVGRYVIDSGYEYWWAFTTTQEVPIGDTVKVDTKNKYAYQTLKSDDDIYTILTATAVPKYVTQIMGSNLIGGWVQGWIDPNTGLDATHDEMASFYSAYRTNYIRVYPGEKYELSLPEAVQASDKTYVGFVICYDSSKRIRDCIKINSGITRITPTGGTFIVPSATGIDPDAEDYKPDAEYIRIAWPNIASDSVTSLHIEDYSHKIYLNDNTMTLYTVLDTQGGPNGNGHGSNLIGLNNLMAQFVNGSNKAYLDYYSQLSEAQNTIKNNERNLLQALGPILREGYWQEASYVEGDETKLYEDAMDNLKEIAKPEATYDISFIDLYSSNENAGFSVDGDSENVPYPDIEITDAVHLVDPAIDVNCWAYIDKVDTCFDKPWETSIEINTRLSLVGQHEFTDVLSSIAEVAKINKNKQSIYDATVQAVGIDVSGTSGNGVAVEGANYNGAFVEGGNFNGVTTFGADYNGARVIGSNYQGVNPEGLDYQGTTIDGQAAAGATLNNELIEAHVIHAGNVSGFITTGSDFINAISNFVTKDSLSTKFDEYLNNLNIGDQVRLHSSVSNWYIDDNGNYIFESPLYNEAIMIGGIGIYGATSKKIENGEWNWERLVTPSGIESVSLASDYIFGKLIEANSITANHVTADFGNAIDISSNIALDLFATVDGARPSGSLKTTDAIIQIHSAITKQTFPELDDQVQEVPFAQINIQSGGEINMKAGAPVEEYDNYADLPRGEDVHENILYYVKDSDKYFFWDAINGNYVETHNAGGINIEASRMINIGSQGKLNLLAGGDMIVHAGGNMDIQAGGAMTIQSGASEGVLGDLDILSTGNINIKSNGKMNILAGVSENDLFQVYDVNGNTFAVEFDENGYASNIYYDDNGYARDKATGYYLYYDQNHKEKVVGGKIVVNSTAGIDVISYGSVKIGSGTDSENDGKIDITSTGSINIASRGTLNLQAGDANNPGGIMNVSSSGQINVGTGMGPDDHDAKILIGSTGEMEISGNGELRLTSVVDDDTAINEHCFEWGYERVRRADGGYDKNEIQYTGHNITGYGSVANNSSKEEAREDAVDTIESYAEAWLDAQPKSLNPETGELENSKADKDAAARAVVEAIKTLEYFYTDNDGNAYYGGRIIVNSSNGIDIESGGSIRIGSGSNQEVDGNININSTGILTIGSNAKLRIDAGRSSDKLGDCIPGEMVISSTGLINMEAGSEMNIGVGHKGDQDAKLNIGSSGEINVDADGSINVRSGGAVHYYAYKWSAFSDIIDEGEQYKKRYTNDNDAYEAFVREITSQAESWYVDHGETESSAAYRDNAIRRTIEAVELHTYDSNGDELYGGKIYVSAINGIELASGGSIKIGAGATGSVNGILSVMSTGQMMIGANAELLLAAGKTDDDKGGKITVDSTGLIDMKAGSEIKIGVGGQGDLNAKLTVGSTGSVDILANGSMRLSAGITKTGVMKYYTIANNVATEFLAKFDADSGKPTNFYYDKNGYAITANGSNIYFDTGKTNAEVSKRYKKIQGSKMIIESVNGMEVKSFGSVLIGSGTEGSEDGLLQIASTGKLEVLGNGQVRLAAGVTDQSVTYYAKSGDTYSAYTVRYNSDGKPSNVKYNIKGQASTSDNRELYTRVGGKYVRAKGASIDIESTGGINIAALGGILVESAGSIDIEGGKIDIAAESGKSGSINIYSSGKLNIETGGEIDIDTGGAIKINSGGEIDICSQGNMNIESGGNLNVESQGAMNIVSGGKLAIEGGSIDITSSGSLTIDSSSKLTVSGGSIDISSSGKFQIGSGGSFTIDSGSTLTITSTNFSVNSSGASIKGKVEATSGSIGDWDIKNGYLNSGSGETFVALAGNSGGYSIWAGNSTAAYAPFSVQSNGSIFAKKGNIAGWELFVDGDTSWFRSPEVRKDGAPVCPAGQVAIRAPKSFTDMGNEGYPVIWAGSNNHHYAGFKVYASGYLSVNYGDVQNFYAGNVDIGKNGMPDGNLDVRGNFTMYGSSKTFDFKNNTITGSGSITGGEINGTSLNVNSGSIKGGSLDVGTGGTIKGGSLNVGTGSITGGAISGSSVSSSSSVGATTSVSAGTTVSAGGQVSGGSLYTAGNMQSGSADIYGTLNMHNNTISNAGTINGWTLDVSNGLYRETSSVNKYFGHPSYIFLRSEPNAAYSSTIASLTSNGVLYIRGLRVFVNIPKDYTTTTTNADGTTTTTTTTDYNNMEWKSVDLKKLWQNN